MIDKLLDRIVTLPLTPEETDKQIAKVKSLRAKANFRRTMTSKIADGLVSAFGSFSSIVLHTIAFGGWILWNEGWLGLPVIDPFPYTFLTSVVSLEAIFLSLFVLMSQDRQTQVADLREEVNLQMIVLAEAEITKLLSMVDEIRQKIGIRGEDKELRRMERRTNTDKIVRELEREIEK